MAYDYGRRDWRSGLEPSTQAFLDQTAAEASRQRAEAKQRAAVRRERWSTRLGTNFLIALLAAAMASWGHPVWAAVCVLFIAFASLETLLRR